MEFFNNNDKFRKESQAIDKKYLPERHL